MQPAVEPASERRLHAVRVALEAKWTVKFLPLVGPAIAVGVAQKPDVRDAPGDYAIPVRINPGGDVQAIGEGGELVVGAIAVGVLEELDRVVTALAKRRGVRVFERARDPQPAALVEGEIHRLANVRTGGDQLHPETVRDVEQLQAFNCVKRISLAHQRLKIRPTERVGGRLFFLKILRLAKRHAS